MRIIDRGILNAGHPWTRRAMATFPSVTVLPDKSLIASYRVGSTKDSDDELIEFRRSSCLGDTWTEPSSPFDSTVDGKRGSLKCVYITCLPENHALACALWVDREAYPGKPLFNPETEGCLPMAVLLADSFDCGKSWTPWRSVPVTEDIGPPSLTSPVLRLPTGELAISIETNKPYRDHSKWCQHVVYLFSRDEGRTWSAPHTVSQDPEARIFYWDQRAAVAEDGRVLAVSWVYDHAANVYLNMRRSISADAGRSWSAPCDLGFADQPSHPAILPDGRVVLAWVDRFGTRSIRARIADALDGEFRPESEVVIYDHELRQPSGTKNTGRMLNEMSLWTYGLPYAEALPNGEVMIVYYAGDETTMTVYWCRLSPD